MLDLSMPEIHWPSLELVAPIGLTLALPAFALAAIVFALIRMGGEKQAPGGAAIAVILGTLVALCVTKIIPTLDVLPKPDPVETTRKALAEALTVTPGESPWNRLAWAALGLLCVGRIVRLPKLEVVDACIIRLASALAIAWWVIPEESHTEIYWLTPAFAGVVLALWILLDYLCAEPPGGTVPLALGLTFFAGSTVLIHAGSMRLAEVSAALSSALIGIALVAYFWSADTAGLAPVTAILLPGLLLMGQQTTFSEVPWYAFALAAGAPLMLAITYPMREWDNAGLRLLQLILVLVPLAGAIWFAMKAGPLEF